MPQVKMPDGTVVEMPETLTPELATRLKALQSSAGTTQEKPQVKSEVKPPESDMQKLLHPSNLLGAGEAVLNAGTSFIAKPVSEIAGLAATAKEAISPTPGGGNPRGFMEDVQNRMTYSPRTYMGQQLSEKNPMALVGQGVNWGGQKAQNLIQGDSDPNSFRGKIGAGTHELINQAPGLVGSKIAKESDIKAPLAQSELDIQRGLNLPKDTIRNASQKAGLTTPIEGTSWVTGIPGLSKVDNWISAANQPKINKLIAENFNLPKGVALTKEEMSAIRSEHNAPYKALENFGEDVVVRPPPTASSIIGQDGKPVMIQSSPIIKKQGFQTTPEFKTNMENTLKQVTDQIAYDPETFSGLIPSARLLRQQLKDEHDPKMTMKQITQLRKDANTMFKSDDPTKIASAFTSRFVADQLENMIEANLEKSGQTQLLNDYRNARKIKAQSYDVESALDNTGNVDARKLYSISKKKPLTDNLKVVADYAGAFPEGAKKVGNAKMAMSPWDWVIAGGSAISHNPLPIAADLAGRVAVPALAGKGLLQKKTPNYQASSVGKIAAPIGVGINAEEK